MAGKFEWIDPMQREFLPMAEARPIPYGTVADLKMRSGRIYRAVLGFRANVNAWWPTSGPRKRPIGTAEPLSVAVITIGDVPQGDWQEAHRRQHAASGLAAQFAHSRARVRS